MSSASGDQRPHCSRVSLKRRPGKVSLHLHGLSEAAHTMGLGFWGFILYICLCLGVNLFILHGAHPIRSRTSRELSVLSCLRGIFFVA